MRSDDQWLATEELRPDLGLALSHLNQAGNNEFFRIYGLFQALNVVFNAHARTRAPSGASDQRTDTAKLRALLTGLNDVETESLMASKSLAGLADLRPLIMDHSDFSGTQPANDVQAEASTEVHQSLIRHIERWRGRKTRNNGRAVMGDLARLLWTVRSNAMHGMKTRTPRDRQVIGAITPVLDDVFESVLDHPSQKLASYGSLSPGRENHEFVASLGGQWSVGFIRGVLLIDAGLSILSLDEGHADQVPVSIFFSPNLPNAWTALDGFEGHRYCRRLAIIETRASCVIGNVYVDCN